ncbi:MAG: thiamine pyrophosphate-dependent enzyme [Firmicutes bacterium]|nr:thiamine pyrophosphate-dependent enzyme [Bacillota bacterium]
MTQGTRETREARWRAYQRWVLIHEVERAVQDLRANGLVTGLYNESSSRAMVAVALAEVLGPQDTLWLDHRNLAFFVANGVNLSDLLAELMGKDNDIARGWAGPLHWSAPWARIGGTNGIVGAPLGLAAGAAWARRYRKEGGVAVAVVGDQATESGIFWETLDLGVRWHLPLCVVVVNSRRHPLPLASAVDAREWGYREMGEIPLDALEFGLDEALEAARRAKPQVVQVQGGSPPAVAPWEEELRQADAARASAIRDQAAAAVREALAKARQMPWAPDAVRLSVPQCRQEVTVKKRDYAALSISEAIRQALEDALADDPRIVVVGEDVHVPPAFVRDPVWGGYFAVAHGLADSYRGRVFEAPVSEAAWMTAALGASLEGLMPVLNMMNMSFAAMGFDALLNQAGAWPWMTAGRRVARLVLRAVVGAGVQAGFQHSLCLPQLFSQLPGVKVVLPATAQDAYSLFIEAIRDPGPVVFLEHVLLYQDRGPVNTEQRVPLGLARVVKTGQAVTVVTYGAMVKHAYEAQKHFGDDAVALIDLRTLEPLDVASVVASLRETRRLVVVDEAPMRGSVAAHLVARVMAAQAGLLSAPPVLVTAPDTPVPYGASAERAYVPSVKRIKEAISRLVAT